MAWGTLYPPVLGCHRVCPRAGMSLCVSPRPGMSPCPSAAGGTWWLWHLVPSLIRPSLSCLYPAGRSSHTLSPPRHDTPAATRPCPQPVSPRPQVLLGVQPPSYFVSPQCPPAPQGGGGVLAQGVPTRVTGGCWWHDGPGEADWSLSPQLSPNPGGSGGARHWAHWSSVISCQR